jgi:beta-galactosidase/beta-glucuronidase
MMHMIARLALFALLFPIGSAFAAPFVIPHGTSKADRARFERFESFQIRGVCGDEDFDRLATLGVNTVRGYTIPDPPEMRKKLDKAHRAGLKVIVSEWMPHHGENKGSGGSTWDFDYDARGDAMVKRFIEKIEGIGDHPAILMWGLGNEVSLDEPYLRVVNRMSLAIHERFPHHVTSLTGRILDLLGTDLRRIGVGKYP